LAGHSYGGFLALDYAVNYPQRLQALVLIDTWTNGTLGSLNVLANILTSDKVRVDKARQVRVWSGNLMSDQDYKEAIAELLPFYAPPATVTGSTKVAATTSAEFFGPGGIFHHKTQNFAFGYNMPRFDVRDRLSSIQVSIRVDF
jgi:proline iminopeptidase